jgi:endonuclease/exonuclease/phosphatase (EEP) superfamily protein YafD
MEVTAALACVLALIALPALAARATGGRPPYNRSKLAALAPAAIGPAIAAVIVAATASWWLALILAVPALILVAWQLPAARRRLVRSGGPRSLRTAGDEAVTLRVLSVNAKGGHADAEAVEAAVREHQVDVLAIQELTPGLMRRLDQTGLVGLLPYHHADPRPGSAGTGLWTRWPLTALPSIQGLRAATPRARIEPVPGSQVTVTAVHPKAPMNGQEARWQAELELIRSELAAVGGAQVVAGDFNASRDHQPFRDLLAAGFLDCADAARRRPWPGYTWPVRRTIPPIMRLDHILVSRAAAATVREARIVRIPGTDHRAVLAVIELDGMPPAAEHDRALAASG